MLKLLQRITLTATLSLALVLGVGFGAAQAATLDPTGQACQAIGAASGASGDCDDPAGPDVDSTLELAINVFSLIVGIAAVIMIIVGGLKYIMSSGDSSNITSAKNTILYAIIGLVIVALAQVILKFVLQKT